MTVAVTCYGGVNEIGGNKILVSDRDTKVLLDFGAGFSEGTDYFSAGIEPRNVNGAGDYFEFGLLPEINGLYSESALQNTEIKHTKYPEVDAILLSHYHYDHTGRIEFVDPEIPVYCGETTALIHQAYSEASGSPLEGHELRTFRTGDKLKVGNLEVEPVHVDHSIPGAYGFVIHTSEGALAYTGDFRFHGPMGRMTEDFVERAAKEKPVALISEGTRVTTAEGKAEFSEKDVAARTLALLKKTQGKLVFSSFRGNDFDRISSFHEACKASGRTLVVSPKVAILLEKLRADKGLKVPELGKEIMVYMRRKRGGKYDDGDYHPWERKFLGHGVTAEQVRKKEKELLVHLDQWYLPELIDIKPTKGGSYIHSITEAFNEEGEQEEQIVKNWVDYFGFSYNHIHASGHAGMEKVGRLVRDIKGESVIPVHTERVDLFPALVKGTSKVLAPKVGVNIPIE